MIITGIDPGFASVGLAAVDLLPKGATIHEVLLVKTKPSNKKLKLGASDDESKRLAEIEDAIRAFLDKWKPKVVSMEDPPWGKNAKAVRTCALMWGAAHGICRERGIPLVNLSAQTIKKAIAGSNSASKEDVLAALKSLHPAFTGWPDTNDVEHVADAAGAAVACRNAPVVYALLSLGAGGLPAR